MNAEETHVLRTLAQLLHGAEMELLHGEEYNGSQSEINTTTSRRGFFDQVPYLLLKHSVKRQVSNLFYTLVVLRQRGLINRILKEFELPPGRWRFSTPGGDFVDMQMLPEDELFLTFVESQFEGQPYTTKMSTHCMEWLSLTREGWKKIDELEAEEASAPTRWVDGNEIIERRFASNHGQLSKMAERNPRIRRPASSEDRQRLGKTHVRYMYNLDMIILNAEITNK